MFFMILNPSKDLFHRIKDTQSDFIDDPRDELHQRELSRELRTEGEICLLDEEDRKRDV